MRENFIKRFAVIFSVLVLLQECTARGVHYQDELDYLDENFLYEYEKDYAAAKSKLPSMDVATFNQPQNDKRSLAVALIVVTGLSAGVDIYKQERGCRDATPDLEGNIRKVNEMQNKAIKQKNQINLDWNPILERENWFQKLGSDFSILRSLCGQLDSLQYDIIQLLDQDVFTKIDLERRKLENAIEANNDTVYGDPNLLAAKFFASPTAYALTLTLKLAPVALWMGSKTIFPYIGKAISKTLARDWATKNPGKIQKMYRNLKSKGLFPKSRAKFSNWVKNNPTLSRIKTKLTLSPKNQIRFKAVKGGIIKFGSVAVVGLFVAYEVYNTWKFVKNCEKKLAESVKMIQDCEGSLQNMTIIQNRMNVLKGQVEGNYTKMVDNLKTESFGYFVEEVKNLSINAQHQTDNLRTAATDLQYFHDHINSTTDVNGNNYKMVNDLTERLLKSFRNTNFKLDCYRKKMMIISQITHDCAHGYGNYASLWKKAKSLEGKTLQNCIVDQAYLSEGEISQVIKGFMEIQKKSPICLRNDAAKKTLICNNWYVNINDAENLKKVGGGLTLADIGFFIQKCEPGQVTASYHDSICAIKSTNQSLASVYAHYVKLNRRQLKLAYDGCKLSPNQKKAICNSRGSGYKLPVIHNTDFYYYKFGLVESVFKACVFTPTPNDVTQICMFSQFLSKGNVSHSIHARDVAKFGRQVVKDILDNCGKANDSGDKANDSGDKANDSGDKANDSGDKTNVSGDKANDSREESNDSLDETNDSLDETNDILDETYDKLMGVIAEDVLKRNY